MDAFFNCGELCVRWWEAEKSNTVQTAVVAQRFVYFLFFGGYSGSFLTKPNMSGRNREENKPRVFRKLLYLSGIQILNRIDIFP